MKIVVQISTALVIIATLIGSIGCSAASTGTTASPPATVNPTQTTSSQPRETVKLRYLGSPGSMNIYRLATELGYAQEEGIEFEDVGIYAGGPGEIQAIGAGSLDLGTPNPVPAINARKAGFKIKIIAVGSLILGYNTQNELVSNSVFIVHEDSNIHGPQDLVGKRIAAQTVGGTADYTIRRWLRSANIPRDQVEVVAIPIANQVQVFSQRQIDVLYTSQQTLALIKETEKVREFPVGDIVGNVVQGGIVVSEDLITKNPEAVRRFLRVYVKTYDWVKENPSEYRKIYERIAKEEGGNPNQVNYILVPARPHALVNDEDIQFWIDELVLDGTIKEGEVKPSDIYTNEYNPYYGK